MARRRHDATIPTDHSVHGSRSRYESGGCQRHGDRSIGGFQEAASQRRDSVVAGLSLGRLWNREFGNLEGEWGVGWGWYRVHWSDMWRSRSPGLREGREIGSGWC